VKSVSRNARDFWVGKTEATQAQWRKVMGDSPSNFKGDDLPVEQVGWSRCVEFCRILTERERAVGRLPQGLVCRLPTEAQWEYAAHGRTKSQGYSYSVGNDLDAVVWHGANSGGKTQRVGTKSPDELGLHDMLRQLEACDAPAELADRFLDATLFGECYVNRFVMEQAVERAVPAEENVVAVERVMIALEYPE
jgi:hypothetical protein